MSLREAAEKVLEAIEYGAHGDPHMARGRIKRAVEALRAALAEAEAPKAEPVAWRVQRTDKAYELFFNKHMAERAAACYIKKPEVEPLYTHPPARRVVERD